MGSGIDMITLSEGLQNPKRDSQASQFIKAMAFKANWFGSFAFMETITTIL